MFKKFFESKNKVRNEVESSVSQHPTSFETLHEKAFLHSQELQKIFDKNWRTNQIERFDADLVQKRICWTLKDGKVIEAPANLIGTWSAKSETFLWGWDHPSCPPADNSAAKAVLSYAEKHEIVELKLRKIEVNEDDAFQVATIGVFLGGLDGIYAAPGSNGSRLFIGFGEVKFSNS